MTRQGKYTANQPLLFPSIYMLNRFVSVRELVIMEEAQFSKFGLHQRILLTDKSQTRVLPHAGVGENMVIMPLANRSYKNIDEVTTHEFPKFVGKFCKTLQTLYGASAARRIEIVRNRLLDCGKTPSLAKVGRACIELACCVADAPCHIVTSRELIGVRPADPSEWVLQMGLATDCKTYLGGGTAMEAYIDKPRFAEAGIELESQNFVCPEWKTKAGTSSNGWISFLDPWMLHGTDFVRDLVRQ